MRTIALLLLMLPPAFAFAQTDAEKFAEGRIALDKHNDCPAAKEALESVSEKSRSEPLWLFYAAKTYECLNQPDKALPLYEKYNQLMPGQTTIIDKIGELRYQAGKLERQKEAEEARQRKSEKDNQERLRLQSEAKANLESTLATLASAITRRSPWQDNRWQNSIAVGTPKCDFEITYISTTGSSGDVGTKWEYQQVTKQTRKATLDLRHMSSAILSAPGEGVIYSMFLASEGDAKANLVESTDSNECIPARPNNKKLVDWCSEGNSHSTHSGAEKYYSLPFGKEVPRDDWILLQQLFQSAIGACHLANGLDWNPPPRR